MAQISPTLQDWYNQSQSFNQAKAINRVPATGYTPENPYAKQLPANTGFVPISQQHVPATGYTPENPNGSHKYGIGMLASMGMGHDTQIAHVTPGEVVIPQAVATANPQLVNQVANATQAQGGNPNNLTVGRGLLNPNTGIQQFANTAISPLTNTTNLNTDPPAPTTVNPNIAIVNSAYNDVLGRTADAQGAAYWQYQLNTGKLTPSTLNAAIANTAAAMKTDPNAKTDGVSSDVFNSSVANAGAYLKNNPATSSLTNTNNLYPGPPAPTGSSLTNPVSTNWWNIPNLQGTTGEQAGPPAPTTVNPNIAIVNSAYNDVLGRTADAQGAAYWQYQLNTGKLTPSTLNAAIANTAAAMKTDPNAKTDGVSSDVFNSSVANAKDYLAKNTTGTGTTGTGTTDTGTTGTGTTGTGTTGTGTTGLLDTHISASGVSPESPYVYKATRVADPAKYNMTNDSSVSGQLNTLLSSGSPLMQQAATQGLEYANSRGLLNSSMASGAAQGEMIKAATPIATSDAQANLAINKYNTDIINQNNIADANSANAANQYSAGNLNAAATAHTLAETNKETNAATAGYNAITAKNLAETNSVAADAAAGYNAITAKNLAETNSVAADAAAGYNAITAKNLADTNATSDAVKIKAAEDAAKKLADTNNDTLQATAVINANTASKLDDRHVADFNLNNNALIKAVASAADLALKHDALVMYSTEVSSLDKDIQAISMDSGNLTNDMKNVKIATRLSLYNTAVDNIRIYLTTGSLPNITTLVTA